MNPPPTEPLYVVGLRQHLMYLLERQELEDQGLADPNGVIMVLSDALNWRFARPYGKNQVEDEPFMNADRYADDPAPNARCVCVADSFLLTRKSFCVRTNACPPNWETVMRHATTQVAGERSGDVPYARAQELHYGRRRAPNPLLRCGDQAQGRLGDRVSTLGFIVSVVALSPSPLPMEDTKGSDEGQSFADRRAGLTRLSVKLLRGHDADREPRQGGPRRHSAYPRVEHEP